MEERPEEHTIPPDRFRYRVLIARLDRGLTTREAAELCGTTSANWSNWERGVQPRDKVDTAEKISRGLGVDVDWLLRGGAMPKEERAGRVLTRKSGEKQPTRYYGSAPIRTRPTPTTGQHGRPTPRLNHTPESHTHDRTWQRTSRKNRPTT